MDIQSIARWDYLHAAVDAPILLRRQFRPSLYVLANHTAAVADAASRTAGISNSSIRKAESNGNTCTKAGAHSGSLAEVAFDEFSGASM